MDPEIFFVASTQNQSPDDSTTFFFGMSRFDWRQTLSRGKKTIAYIVHSANSNIFYSMDVGASLPSVGRIHGKVNFLFLF